MKHVNAMEMFRSVRVKRSTLPSQYFGLSIMHNSGNASPDRKPSYDAGQIQIGTGVCPERCALLGVTTAHCQSG